MHSIKIIIYRLFLGKGLSIDIEFPLNGIEAANDEPVRYTTQVVE